MFVSGLILAAGRGARMGRTKQLLPVGGRTLIAHVVATALQARLDEVVVVLGHGAKEIRSALVDFGGPVRFVVNPDHREGQSTSLAAGLDALSPRADAAVVLLGDQPSIPVETIDAVVAAFATGDALAARAVYDDGIARHPTVIGRALWDEVRAVGGDAGARDVLARHSGEVLRVAVDARPPDDVDTPADYAALVDRWNPRS